MKGGIAFWMMGKIRPAEDGSDILGIYSVINTRPDLFAS